jgi:hypothetical protein
MKRKIFALAVSLFAFEVATLAQSPVKFDFYDRGPYRPEVPTPQSMLRYDVGEHHTTYAQMEAVIEAVRRGAPDRVRIFDIGLTNEFRMQHIVAISAPANIERLDEIRAQNLALTDPRTTTPAQAEAVARRNPAIAWMAYTIHGNESASFETMMQVVYHLAASNEPATLNILANTLVLVITGENPDGHERFATWYNSVGVGDPNRAALEHREPWSVYGRLNRFRFDLNRDNISASQLETRNMQGAFFEWNPHVVVDHHGQPSQFFFPPVALPINPNLPQPVTNRWMDIFGRANAEAFDRRNWDYYNRDIFDLFYPGYWDSYPSLNGAVGMTYETDGGGFKGLLWTRDDGTTVSFRSAIAKHYVASLTTLETLSKNKEQRVRDFYDFRRNALAEANAAKLKRIVVVPDKDPVKAAEMMEILRRGRVDVKVAAAPFTSTTAHPYDRKNAPAQQQTFPAGSYVIDLNQPQRLLIKALMEQETPQDEAFVREEIAKFRRNEMRGKAAPREEYRFYDITAWSLPLAFGLDAYWTEEWTSVDSRPLSDEMLRAARTGGVSGRAQVAYLIPYKTDAAAVLAMRLLGAGFRVGASTRPLTAEGKTYPAGTFVIRISRNDEKVHDAVARLSRELGAGVLSVNSGFINEGDTPVGGENVVPLQTPKIAIVADEGVDPTSFGSIWWTLDRYGVKFTAMSLSNVRNGALKAYNVLIIPDGQPGRYFGTLGKAGVDALRAWTSAGGTVVTVRGASVFAALKDVGLTSAKLVGSDDDDEKPRTAEGPEPAPAPTESRTDKQDWTPALLPPIASPSANRGQVPEGVPGAIMRATVDRTVYLNFGTESNELPVLLSSGYFFRYSKEGTNALVFDAKPSRPLTVSGFVWEGNTERLLAGTSYLIDEPTGSGRVVLFADEPFFRGIFRSVTRQFFNAILFAGAV